MMNVKNLNAGYETENGYVPILNKINFSVKKNIILGIAGESGSGKSTLASVLYNSFKYPGKITGGDILFKGNSLLKMRANELRKIRGTQISIINNWRSIATVIANEIEFLTHNIIFSVPMKDKACISEGGKHCLQLSIQGEFRYILVRQNYIWEKNNIPQVLK